MRIFNLGNGYMVICNVQSTRNGFKHTATLCLNGIEQATTKIGYINRTWEAYEYEDVLKKIIIENFDGEEKGKYMEAIKYENIRG